MQQTSALHPERTELTRLDSTIDMFREFDELVGTIRRNVLTLDTLAMMLWLEPHPRSSAGEITRALSFSPSKTTRCIRQLIDLELIEEQLQPDDLRKSLFSLSNRGENAAFEISRKLGAPSKARILENYLTFRECHAQACRLIGRQVSDLQFRILLVLHAAQTPLCVNDVVRAVSSPQSSTSTALKTLSGCRLVNLTVGKNDARMVHAVLSKRGRQILDVVAVPFDLTSDLR